jgi:glycine/D-amino acid oxidase-like deaminating enzyme
LNVSIFTTSTNFGDFLANNSLWMEGMKRLAGVTPLDQVPGKVDVAIVGAGFTGLWTAYYLKRQCPELRIVLFEARHVAFGATGRNGGWAVGSLWEQHGRMAGLNADERCKIQTDLHDMVDEIGRVASAENIDCDFHKGGMLRVAARNPLQLKKLDKTIATFDAENAPTRYAQRLSAAETSRIINVRQSLGAMFTPDCAVLNPARLALGLAEVICQMGVQIVESAQVDNISSGTVFANGRRIQADMIVPAGEAYSETLAALSGRLIPVHSFAMATEPMSERHWADIGLNNREAFSDCSDGSTYGQRTADNRVVFGALATYQFKGALKDSNDHFLNRFALTEALLRDLFPQLKAVAITHRWAGALGVSRSFKPAIFVDHANATIWGGGYAGRGVGASNLFGRTIADLIAGNGTPRTKYPWVYDGSDLSWAFAEWESEPLRWIGCKVTLNVPEISERITLSRHVPQWLKVQASRIAHAIVAAVS